jgi:hypothetical protein
MEYTASYTRLLPGSTAMKSTANNVPINRTNKFIRVKVSKGNKKGKQS